MLKIIIGGVIAFAILGCIAGIFEKSTFIYVLYSITAVAAIFPGLSAPTANFIWIYSAAGHCDAHPYRFMRFSRE